MTGDPDLRHSPTPLGGSVSVLGDLRGDGPGDGFEARLWDTLVQTRPRLISRAEKAGLVPPSHTANPGMPWSPPRTETSRSWSGANRTLARTSAAPAQQATTSGRRTIMPLRTVRAPSSPALAASCSALAAPSLGVTRSAPIPHLVWLAIMDSSGP
jgi:hypothetical protein